MASDLTVDQLSTLVARVVRELLRQHDVASATKPQVERGNSTAALNSVQSGIEFDGAVLSSGIVASWPAKEQVHISSRAVITPAARDLARAKQIRLMRGAREIRGTRPGFPILAADADGGHRCGLLARQLGLRGWTARGVGLRDLIRSCAAGEALGIVLADLAAPAVWRLHEEGRLRAAQLVSLDRVPAIVAAMQPQVWVLEMSSLTVGTALHQVERCLQQSEQSSDWSPRS